MDLHQLRVLRELGARGSVAAVARALYVTPSAVSQHLSALQRHIGVALTEKRGRVLALTEAGRALAAAAVKVSAAFEAAEQAIAAYHDDPHQTVTVSAFHSAGLAYFAPLIERLTQIGGPVVRCRDEDVAQEDFPPLVADYDLVIAHRLIASEPWPDSVAVTPLIYEPLDIALPAHHPLVKKASLTALDVRDESWIAVHEGFPLVGAIHTIAALAEKPLAITHRINEFFVAASVVASGAAISLMPRYTATPTPDSGIVLRPLEGVEIGRHIDILTRPETLLRSSIRRVIHELSAVAAPKASPR